MSNGDLCNELCSSVWPAGWFEWQKLYRWTLHANFSANFFIHAMLIGTIDFYRFITLSLTLTWAGHHKGSAEQNLLASFSRTLFN